MRSILFAFSMRIVLVPGPFLAQRRAGGTAPEPVDARGDSWCLYPINSSRLLGVFSSFRPS